MASSGAVPPRTRPAGRYDDRRGRPRPALVAALVVLAGAFGAWVVWAALGAATPDVRSQLLGYHVVDGGHVRARFEVYAAADRRVTCTLRAEDRTGEPVGVTRATVPASGAATRRATVVIRTRSRAVTAVVAGCILDRPTG